MGHRVDCDGIVYDLGTGDRIGVVNKGSGGIVLDEDVYRDDGRYDDTADVGWSDAERSPETGGNTGSAGRLGCD